MQAWPWVLERKKGTRIRGIEPRAAARLARLRGGNVSRYTISDLVVLASTMLFIPFLQLVKGGDPFVMTLKSIGDKKELYYMS